MFAALTVARLREASAHAGLLDTASWRSPDDVQAGDLPLARAVERVLESMQAVLKKTMLAYEKEMEMLEAEDERAGLSANSEGELDREAKRHLRRMRASEVRVVRNVGDLLLRETGEEREKFPAAEVLVDASVSEPST